MCSMKVTYSPGPYTELEKQGVQWLARRMKFSVVRVSRASDSEFDLVVDGDVSTQNGVTTPFVYGCLQQWREFDGLKSLLKHNPNGWSVFYQALSMATRRPMFSPEFLDAVHETWGMISPDADVDSNAEAIELVLDADRLTLVSDEANEELRWFDQRFGPMVVAAELEKVVALLA